MIGIIGILSVFNNVVLLSINFCFSWDVDDGIIFMVNVFVVGEFIVVYILNRVVIVRSFDVFELILIYIVDVDFLEDWMVNIDVSEVENSFKVGDFYDGGREREEILNMSWR